MYYIKDRNEQKKIIDRVKDIYKYNYIELQNLELYKKFKYATFIEDGFDIYFNNSLCEFIDSSIEEYLTIFITDMNVINLFYESESLYPSIVYKIEELKSRELNTTLSNEISIEDEGTNICILPSSMTWMICINKNNELSCFVSNNKNLNLKFNKIFKNEIGNEVSFTKDELIKNFKIARNEEEFNKLPISKLEIIT